MRKILIAFLLVLVPAAFWIFSTFQSKALYEALAQHLYVHDAYDKDGAPLELRRMGRDYDGGYVVPVLALKQAEALLGYGIADDISFEEAFADTFQKPSYGFDGGVEGIKTKNPLCTFIPECIGTDRYLYAGQKSGGKVSSFSQQLERLKLKSVFIKMDIEGAEYEVLPDVLTHAANITGIVLELHGLKKTSTVKQAVALLAAFEKDFVLLHVHGNNVVQSSWRASSVEGEIPVILELTYIHKRFLSRYQISKHQKHPTSLDQPNIADKPDVSFGLKPKV